MKHNRSATGFFLRQGFVVAGIALTITLCLGTDEKREALSILHQAWQKARRIDDPRERALALHRVAQTYAQLERLEEARAAFYESLMTAVNEDAVYMQGELLRTLLTSSIVAKLCPEVHPQVPTASRRYSFDLAESPDALLAAVAETARESLRCAPVAPADLCTLLDRFREPDWYVEASLSTPSLRFYRPRVLLDAGEVHLRRGDYETAYRLFKRCFYELVRLQLPHILKYDDLYNHLCNVQAQGGWYDDAYLTWAWLRLPWEEDYDYFSFLAGKLIQNSQFDAAYQIAMLIPETKPAMRARQLHQLARSMAQSCSYQPHRHPELKPIFLQALKDALAVEGSTSFYGCVAILTAVLDSQRHFLNPQDALDNLRVIELDPPPLVSPENMARIYYAIGLALLKMRRVEEAEPYLILALLEPGSYRDNNLAASLSLLSRDNPTAQRLRVVYDSFSVQESERRRQQEKPRGSFSRIAGDSSEKLSQKELGQPVDAERQHRRREEELFFEVNQLYLALSSSFYPRSRGALLGRLESLHGVALQMPPSPRRAELLLHIAEAYSAAGLHERAAACVDLSVPDLVLWKQENWEAIVLRAIQTISYNGYSHRESSLPCLPNPFLRGSAVEVILVEYLLKAAQLCAYANRLEEGRWILQHASKVIFLWGSLGAGADWLPRLYQVSKQLGDETITDQVLRYYELPSGVIGSIAPDRPSVEALATLAEGYRAAGQLRQARALIAQAIDEAQGFAQARIVESTLLQQPALWFQIGLRLIRLDEATLRRQRRETRHPLVRRGIDALLTRSAQHRAQLLREARSLESPIRRAWLLTLIGVGSKRMGDAATAAQAFMEATNAVNEIMYLDTRLYLQSFITQTQSDLRSMPETPHAPTIYSPEPPYALLYPELQTLLDEGKYLEAFRTISDKYPSPHRALLYDFSKVISLRLAQDPRRWFLLPAIYQRLSKSEYLSVALALIETNDYRNALHMALNTREEDIFLEIVMRTAVAQAQHGQKEIALATLEQLDSLLVNPKLYEFEINDFMHQIYLALGEFEKAKECLSSMRRAIERLLELEIVFRCDLEPEIVFRDDFYYYNRLFRFVEALARTGNHDEARRLLLRRTPQYRETLLEIAAVQAHWGYWDDALATLETLVRDIAYISCPTPEFQVQMAEVLFRLLKTPYRASAMRLASLIVYAWQNYEPFSEWLITRCLLQGDHDTARFLAVQFPVVPSRLIVRFSRADALTQLAAYWARIGAESEWRPLYNELMHMHRIYSKHSRAFYDALAHHGRRHEAAALLARDPGLPTKPLVEAGEYDLLLSHVAPSETYCRQLNRLAAQLTRTLGLEETLRYLRQLDSPIYQFEWLIGIVGAKIPSQNPPYLIFFP